MALSLRYTTHSEVGLVRKNNQDSGYASPTMVVVADGMGGAAAGDLASAVAIAELRRADQALPSDLHGDGLLDVLGDVVRRANHRIADLVEANPDWDGMGTTVCGFIFDAGTLALVNIGDSRAYRYRDGHLTRLTRDHSWIQTLVDDGRLTEAEALLHPHRSLILKVINGSPAHTPDLTLDEVRAGDRLLVCSDGLCGLVTDAAIAAHLAGDSRDEVLKALVGLAHQAGGLDNITIIVADVVEGEPEGAAVVLGAAGTIVPAAANDVAEALPDETAEPTTATTAATESPASAAASPNVPDDPDQDRSERDRYALRTRRPMVRLTLAILLPLVALTGGGAWWYSYTQQQYYVGASDATVAIYQGVPDTIAGFPLSHLFESDTTQLSDLPPFYQEKVRATIQVADLSAARNTVAELRQKATLCIEQRAARARATQSPTPTSTESPTPASTESPDPTASPEPTPSVTTAPAPEEC